MTKPQLGERNAAEEETRLWTAYLIFPWWTHPLVPAAPLILLMFLSTTIVSPYSYALWGTPEYITNDHLMTAAVSVLAFVLGAFLLAGSATRRARSITLGQNAVARCVSLLKFLFGASLVGYAFWFVTAVMRGASAAQLMQVLLFAPGAVSQLKHVSAPIAGVTTLTQFAPLAVALAVFLRRIGIGSMAKYIWPLLALAIFRAFFYAERLALIEIVVPIVLIIAVVHSNPHRSTNNRRIATWVPFFSVPALWVLFGVFEYSRSWTYYRHILDVSFVEFNTQRLVGYYVTAINNSSLYHDKVSGTVHDPVTTFSALWEAPILGSLLGQQTPGSFSSAASWWQASLQREANPEFNNVGTFLVTDADLGTVGSAIFWLIMGALIGLLYSRARNGAVWALVFYSAAFVGVLEILRLIYWTQGRFVPVVIGGLVLAVALRAVEGDSNGGRRYVSTDVPCSFEAPSNGRPGGGRSDVI